MLERLEKIKKDIINSQYPNEISVIDGIIKPLLHALNWDIFDTIDNVIPEYSIAGKRVDIALCYQKKSYVFVECKRMGGIDDNAQEQLLNYAFHEGVPMAILTDGRHWNFYLPAEQGKFRERQFYQLDLVERETVDIKNKLNRYLKREFVISGKAIENAKKDYKDVKKDKEIITQLPKAWKALIEDKDELLVEVLAEKVESMCGYKVSEKAVLYFLHTLNLKENKKIEKPVKTISNNNNLMNNKTNLQKPWFEFRGKTYSAKSNVDMVVQIIPLLFPDGDLSLIEKSHDKRINTKARSLVSRDINTLYKNKDRGWIEGKYRKISPGWYIGTNYGTSDYKDKIKAICELCGIAYDEELIVKWKY